MPTRGKYVTTKVLGAWPSFDMKLLQSLDSKRCWSKRMVPPCPLTVPSAQKPAGPEASPKRIKLYSKCFPGHKKMHLSLRM